MCFAVAAIIPAFNDLSDPDYKEYFVSGSKSILTLIQENKSLQELYPYLEETLGTNSSIKRLTSSELALSMERLDDEESVEESSASLLGLSNGFILTK